MELAEYSLGKEVKHGKAWKGRRSWARPGADEWLKGRWTRGVLHLPCLRASRIA